MAALNVATAPKTMIGGNAQSPVARPLTTSIATIANAITIRLSGPTGCRVRERGRFGSGDHQPGRDEDYRDQGRVDDQASLR